MRGGPWLRTRVRSLLAYWIPRLALSNWLIDVRWRPDREMDGHVWRSFNALTVRYARRMDAVLYFNVPALARDNANERAIEEIVVHELVHVLLGLGEKPTNTIARALVRARRNP